MKINFTSTTLIQEALLKCGPNSLVLYFYTGNSIIISVRVGIMEYKNYRTIRSAIMRDMEMFYK